ncbi:hypothetical protein P7K49_005173 [Saguinus oedipus]|uniref:Uncharacterized protein n=1 Tax=Saguinus oedipus TaxID=9490 RepID=A0ABQ9W9I5_SAGOE|nr:hypothetical protein P7K49_005173 [Saguinus oedipus]
MNRRRLKTYGKKRKGVKERKRKRATLSSRSSERRSEGEPVPFILHQELPCRGADKTAAPATRVVLATRRAPPLGIFWFAGIVLPFFQCLIRMAWPHFCSLTLFLTEELIEKETESTVSRMQSYPLKEIVVIHQDPEALRDITSLEKCVIEDVKIT